MCATMHSTKCAQKLRWEGDPEKQNLPMHMWTNYMCLEMTFSWSLLMINELMQIYLHPNFF